MKNFEYGKEIIKSFKEIFNKPVLLLPFVYSFLLTVLFLYITPQMPNYAPNEVMNIALITWILGLMLIQAIIGLAFAGMGLAGFRMYTSGEEVTAKKQAEHGLRMYWKLLLLKIYQLMILLIPIVLLLAIYFGVDAINATAGLIVGLILLIGYIVYLFTMLFYFLFSNVLIAYDGKGAGDALKESYYYFKKNSAHTFFTMIGLFVLGLLLLMVIMLVAIPFAISEQTHTIQIWQNIVTSFITIPIMAAGLLYLFKAFLFNPNEEEKTKTTEVKIVSSSVVVENNRSKHKKVQKTSAKNKVVPAPTTKMAVKKPVAKKTTSKKK